MSDLAFCVPVKVLTRYLIKIIDHDCFYQAPQIRENLLKFLEEARISSHVELVELGWLFGPDYVNAGPGEIPLDDPAVWEEVAECIDHATRRPPCKGVGNFFDSVVEETGKIVRLCRLDDTAATLLSLLRHTEKIPGLSAIYECVRSGLAARRGISSSDSQILPLTMMLGVDAAKADVLSSGVELLQELGLIGSQRFDIIKLTDLAHELMALPADDSAGALAAAIGSPEPLTGLSLADFCHVPNLDLALTALKVAAIRAEETASADATAVAGSNIDPSPLTILIVGPAESGKSALARVLCHSGGFEAIAIGADSDQSLSPAQPRPGSSEGLKSAYRRAVRILRPTDKTMMLMDPIPSMSMIGNILGKAPRRQPDDDFGYDVAPPSYAADLMVENDEPAAAPGKHGSWLPPSIWSAERREQLPREIWSRATVVLTLPPIPLTVREVVVKATASKLTLQLTNEQAHSVAIAAPTPSACKRLLYSIRHLISSGMTISDAQLTSIIHMHGSIGSSRPDAIRAISLDQRVKPPVLSLISAANVDLSALLQRIADQPHQLGAVLLYGAPGSGKSEFARMIARAAGLDTLIVASTELLHSHVGESEAAIKELFAKAKAHQQMLIFEEVDTLLNDRHVATRSWERSQTNSMLTALERHSLPVICTTNAATWLDTAAMRRFPLKIEFTAMGPGQIAHAFEHFYGKKAPASIFGLEGLCVGDFAAIARKAELMAVTDAETLATWLAEEIALRQKPAPEPQQFILRIAKNGPDESETDIALKVARSVLN